MDYKTMTPEEIIENVNNKEMEPTVRRALTRIVNDAWLKQGRDRGPVVFNFQQASGHPDETHFIKVVYSVQDPTFDMSRSFIQHLLNLKDGSLHHGHYDLSSSQVE